MSTSSSLRPSTATHPPQLIGAANYEKLYFIYSEAAPEFLRQVFRQLWKCLMKSPWVDGKGSGIKLIKTCASVLGNKWRKERVEYGNCGTWDLPLLLDIIDSLRSQMTPDDLLQLLPTIQIIGINPKNFEFLKATKKMLATAPDMSIDKILFETLWNKTASVLAMMGMDPNLLFEDEEISSQPKASKKVTTESSRKAEEFRSAGNEFFNKTEFAEAAAEYSQGIQLQDVPRELLGLLFSNRSAAKLELKDIEAAKYDAKCCVTLRPSWFRGYARLGKAYEQLKKFDKAALNLKIAIHRGDTSKKTLDAFNFCSLTVKSLSIEKPSGLQGINLDLQRPEGFCVTQLWPGLQLRTLGHRYLKGSEGFPVDINKASEFFSKAADLGDAMGLYELGKMHQNGVGFPRNTAKAHALFLQAAAQDPFREFVEGSGEILVNFGVPESCERIGRAFHLGRVDGVAVDLLKALKWYGKALEFGHFLSALWIANVFMSGEIPGFPGSSARVMDYLKLAAHLKVLKAMEFLAMGFREMGLLGIAQEYFHFAILKGSVDLRERRAEFVRDYWQERKFDGEKFEAQLEEEVRGSDVVGPILKKIEDFQEKVRSGVYVSGK